ncbi:unnamed protein product [Mesocestoides corti]|uniref:COP9 signalosome complex subunit 6 n=2 Tax=Mesocestoides corti TaxID=53468 RepID=A0A0R3UNW4_MESCO|nr:unnamed protein product [Mesocestoides corti]
MEVDSDDVNESLNQGGISVLVHPLVILNIAEHWTREKLARDSISTTVHGALLGKHNGREVELFNSFEILLNEDMSVNLQFFATREGQCKVIYPDLDFVGWYTTGGVITEQDKLFNCQMQDISESLLILKLNPVEKFGEHLPVRVYESAVANDAQVLFRQVPFTLVHDAMERIGVDHIARASGSAGSSNETSLTADCLLGNFQAVQMFSKRLHLIRAYVDAVIAGELPPNWARLREIRALLSRLPLTVGANDDQQSKSRQALLRQANDVCLTALLGGLTQTLYTLHTWLCLQKSTFTHLSSTQRMREKIKPSTMSHTFATPQDDLLI